MKKHDEAGESVKKVKAKKIKGEADEAGGKAHKGRLLMGAGKHAEADGESMKLVSCKLCVGAAAGHGGRGEESWAWEEKMLAQAGVAGRTVSSSLPPPPSRTPLTPNPRSHLSPHHTAQGQGRWRGRGQGQEDQDARGV